MLLNTMPLLLFSISEVMSLFCIGIIDSVFCSMRLLSGIFVEPRMIVLEVDGRVAVIILFRDSSTSERSTLQSGSTALHEGT